MNRYGEGGGVVMHCGGLQWVVAEVRVQQQQQQQSATVRQSETRKTKDTSKWTSDECMRSVDVCVDADGRNLQPE